jgi:hypothetical protein
VTGRYGGVGATAFTVEDAPQRPEDAEGLVAPEEDAPQRMEAIVYAEAPEV